MNCITKKFVSLSNLASISFILNLFCTPTIASAAPFTRLNGDTEGISDFVSWGSCLTLPLEIQVNDCGPVRLHSTNNAPFVSHFFLSASSQVLELSDEVDSEKPKSETIAKALQSHTTRNAILTSRVHWKSQYFNIGIEPFGATGSFAIHNENLPLVSIVTRQDNQFFVGLGRKFQWSGIELLTGGRFSLINRKETIIEATLVDLASQSPTELKANQNLKGYFLDIGAVLSFESQLQTGIEFKNIGKFTDVKYKSTDYLFIDKDREPRALLSTTYSWLVWFLSASAGGHYIEFLEGANDPKSQWFIDASLVSGPLKILATYHLDMLRTGISIQTGAFTFSMAQQWLAKNNDTNRITLALEIGGNSSVL